MGIRLFLDDVGKCPNGFAVARSYDECIMILSQCDVEVLSLDHDLGDEHSGYDVAKWIVNNGRWPMEIRFHTSNPVGRANMRQLLARYAPAHVTVGT